jgi:hypothetical protein
MIECKCIRVSRYIVSFFHLLSFTFGMRSPTQFLFYCAIAKTQLSLSILVSSFCYLRTTFHFLFGTMPICLLWLGSVLTSPGHFPGILRPHETGNIEPLQYRTFFSTTPCSPLSSHDRLSLDTTVEYLLQCKMTV